MAAEAEEANLNIKISCVMKTSVDECVSSLKNGEADTFTTDGGHIFNNYQLVKPVLAEDYGFGKFYSFIYKRLAQLLHQWFFIQCLLPTSDLRSAFIWKRQHMSVTRKKFKRMLSFYLSK